MNEMDFIKMFSEFVKNSIDNNPNYSEWEKWWRKSGVEKTEEYAKQLYEQKETQFGTDALSAQRDGLRGG